MIGNNRRMNRYTCLRQMLIEESFGGENEQNS